MTRIAIATLMFFALFEPEVKAASTLWLCGLTEDGVGLACVADTDPSSAGEPPPAPLLSVNGTAFPLDPRRVYFVDLWSPPTEMEFVAQLANATICYRSPGCKVVMTTDRRAATAATWCAGWGAKASTWPAARTWTRIPGRGSC